MFFAIGMKCIHMFIVANISTYMWMLCGTGVYWPHAPPVSRFGVIGDMLPGRLQ
jgi:hypothetical protein